MRKRERDNAEVSGKRPRIAGRPRTAWPMPSGSWRRRARSSIARYKARRAGTAGEADVDKARDAVNRAKDRLEQARATLRKALAADDLPTPTRPEAALDRRPRRSVAAEAALERTRIRAASAARSCRSTPRWGRRRRPRPRSRSSSSAICRRCRSGPSSRSATSARCAIGQTAIVRSDAFPGKDFEGKIASLAQTLGPSRVGQRGPRKPTDVDVLEVLIDMVGQPPLLPGHARRRVPAPRGDGRPVVRAAAAVRRRGAAGKLGV